MTKMTLPNTSSVEVWDLKEIFNLQAELDKHIEAQHHLNSDNIWVERKLALLVELGETANEIRSFKFWSLKEPSSTETIIEEYSDGLHFITSLCLYFKVDSKLDVYRQDKFESKREITDAFIKLYQTASYISDSDSAKRWYEQYLEFGLGLGFNKSDIVNAYKAKCKINHQRQVDKY